MARLFFSLYLFIAVALVILSVSLESVFYDDLPSPRPESETLRHLMQALPPSQLRELAMSGQLNLTIRAADTLAWPSAEWQRLQQGDVVSLYDELSGHQLYRLIAPNQLAELSVGKAADEGSRFALYSTVFFILLGGALAIWLWPLWRDLTRLRTATEHLGQTGQMEPVDLPPGSLVTPIASALNAMQLQVLQLLQTQRELTGAVAHEFRTPLSRLKFALEALPKDDMAASDAMGADIDELQRLVQEMLDFTSMEAQQPELSNAEIPLQELCQALVNRQPDAITQGKEITVSGEDISIVADAHYLERALENLLLNALRYAQNRVQIRLEQNAADIWIFVEDDGPGVNEALSERIFEPFFRPDGSRDRKRGGAGLGLAIVKRVALWLEGECGVKRSVLGGASFFLRLPKS